MSKKDKKGGKKARREEVAPAELVVPEVVDDLPGGGARLCYGDPVREGGRTVIPVARVGGSRDAIGAKPLGYIEVDATGARYTALDGPGRGRVVAGALALAAGLLGGLAGAVLGRRSR